MRHSKRLGLVFMLSISILLIGCTDNDTGGEGSNKAPQVRSVSITPPRAEVDTTLRAVVRVEDKENDLYKLEYQWFADGQEINGATGEFLDTSEFPPETVIHVTVKPVEQGTGKEGISRGSKKVTLQPPPAKVLGGVSLEPENIHSFTEVTAVVDYGTVDPYEVDEIFYRWYVNNEPLEDEDYNSSVLSPDNFDRGDRIRVKVSTDGNFDSKKVISSKIYTVVNASPYFVEKPLFDVHDNRIYLDFEVEDPEGDRLNVSINGGPPGMKQDNRGVYFTIPRNSPGSYPVTITATDGHGGRATLKSTVDVPDLD